MLLRVALVNVLRFILTNNIVDSSPILVTLMIKIRFLQDPHGVKSHKPAFNI
jgi:hypothetical protein